MLLFVFLPILGGAWRRCAVTFAVVAVLVIGFSHVRYVSDVVGGRVLGVARAAAMAAAFNVTAVNRERRVAVTSGWSGSDDQELGGPPDR